MGTRSHSPVPRGKESIPTAWLSCLGCQEDQEDGEPRGRAERELPTQQLLRFAKPCPTSFFLFSFFFLRLPPFPFPPGFSPSGPALLSLYSFSCKVLHQAWIRKRSHKWQGAGPAARSKTSLSPLVAALGPSLCPLWGSACPHPARRHRDCPFDQDRGEGPQPDGLLVSLMRRETHLGMEGAGRKRF